MRKTAVLLCLCVFVFVSLAATAQLSEPGKKTGGDELPNVIIVGLQALKDKGPDEAVRAWLKGSGLEGSKDALSQGSNLRRVQDFYGGYRAVEIVATRDISPKVRIFYLVIDLEKGPMFARFTVYRAEEGWILTNFNFNTEYDQVFPSEIVPPACRFEAKK